MGAAGRKTLPNHPFKDMTMGIARIHERETVYVPVIVSAAALALGALLLLGLRSK